MENGHGSDSPTPPAPVFLWNDSLHRSREAATLQFWRISLAPQYEFASILKSLQTVFARVKIVSYIIYETLGEFDLLIRMWVPQSIDPESLWQQLKNGLQKETFWDAEYLLVTQIVRHWIWQSARNNSATPLEPDGELPLSNNLVQDLDSYNIRATEYANPRVSIDEDFRKPHHIEPPEAPDFISDYVDHNYLMPVDLDRRGIRFYIYFDHPRKGLRLDERENLIQRILDTCDEVLEETLRECGPNSRPSVSVYTGYGRMTDVLLMCRAPDGHFYSFMRRLLFGIHKLRLDRLYEMRTYTHVMADRNFRYMRERLAIRNPPIDIDLLLQPESESLEYKASLSIDVRKFLINGRSESIEGLIESNMRALCGLLNSPNGGVLVIGALELTRELERFRGAERQRIWERIREEAPIYPEEADAPDGMVANAKALFGIELEFRGPRNEADWDAFVRKFSTLAKNRISPNPMTPMHISPLYIAGRTLAIVTVGPSEYWYYLQSDHTTKFFVRELAETREYRGVDADMYRQAFPRSTGMR